MRATSRLDRRAGSTIEEMATGIGWLRVAVGVALATASGPLLRASTGEQPSGSMLLLARTVGIRDLVLGAGLLSALRSGATSETRRWLAVGLTSDVLDAVAGMVSAPLIGKRQALFTTGLTLPVIAAGCKALVTTQPS